MANLFDLYRLDVSGFIDPALRYMATDLRPFFQSAKIPFAAVLDIISHALVTVRPEIVLAVLFVGAWQMAGLRVATWSTLGLAFVGFLGVWPETMITLGLVTTSVVFAVVLGMPIGILMARLPVMERICRPILNTMQTLPAFVYLIPIVVMFGIGNVPGVIVTIIYAIPPIIRLTCLGIREVPAELREAAEAYGASGMQTLRRIELPVAMPTILAGINQTIMMALGMVVYSSMIAVKGLGLIVLRGIGSMDMNQAFVGGAGIVVLAMILDRLSESAFGRPRSRPAARRGSQPSDLAKAACRLAAGTLFRTGASSR